MTSGASFTPAANSCTVPNGGVFNGWSVSGTSDVKPAGTAFNWGYTESKTLTANITQNTLNVNWWNENTQLTVPSESQTCVYGESITVPTINATKPGYHFNGWKIKQ